MSSKLGTLKFILQYSKKSGDCLRCSIGLDKYGYSSVTFAGKQRLTHRVIMHLVFDFDLDSKLFILHSNEKCNYRNCIEVNHLRTGIHSENIIDAYEKHGKYNTKLYCPKGHKKGLHWGSLRCLICAAESRKRYKQKIASGNG